MKRMGPPMQRPDGLDFAQKLVQSSWSAVTGSGRGRAAPVPPMAEVSSLGLGRAASMEGAEARCRDAGTGLVGLPTAGA